MPGRTGGWTVTVASIVAAPGATHEARLTRRLERDWGMAMIRRLGIRFWVATFLTIASSGLAVLTLLVPTWIERLFGVDPDGGSGALEVGLALLPLMALAGLVVARVQWRRMRLLEARQRGGSPTR